jgi:cytochrome c-type biogenesis protein CcmH/NrfG
MRGHRHHKLQLGVELNSAGRLKEAVDALEEGLKAEPDFAGGWWLLGAILWELGEYSRAIEPCRRAVSLRPRSERYSLGLFHALLDAGLAEETIAEVRRFLREAENGAKCSEGTQSLYERYDQKGAALVAEWKKYKNSGE